MANTVSVLAVIVLLLLAPFPAAWGADGGAADSLRQAKALREQSRGLLGQAEAAYRAALRENPRSLEAARGLARVLRDRGAEEEAIPYLRDVAERSGEGVDRSRLGWALFRAGEWAESSVAFKAAREHGMDDAETRRGEALAATAAHAGAEIEPGARPAADSSGAPEGAWQQAWGHLVNGTGVIADTIVKLILWLIALALLGGIASRVWGTLTGQATPSEDGGIRLTEIRGLPVIAVESGATSPAPSTTRRGCGRVRRMIYDPDQRRVVGLQVGSGWGRWLVALSDVRGVGTAGVLIGDSSALTAPDRSPALAALAKAGARPLGPGSHRKRVVSEDGAPLGFANPDRLRMNPATGELTFDLTPSRFHEAWRMVFSLLQIGPVDWLMGTLLDRGLELLPGRISARVRMPVDLIHSANRDLVVLGPEAVEWIDRHFQQREAEARAGLEQVRAGLARARPVLEQVRDAGLDRARPVLERAKEAGAARARPVLERVRETGLEVVRQARSGSRSVAGHGGSHVLSEALDPAADGARGASGGGAERAEGEQ